MKEQFEPIAIASLEIPVSSRHINVPDVILPAEISIPLDTECLVIFVHGSGSSRLSPRNLFVGHHFEDQKMGTLLFDLLTEEEDSVYETRFNIDLLTERLLAVTEWITRQEEYKNLRIGYFGASTGAAAALKAAAALGENIFAVVSRGGRPDLAMPDLGAVKAPTLLIVGGLDTEVIDLNQQAAEELTKCIKELTIVEGATHLFEEDEKLEEVSRLATDWFKKYLLKGL